MQIILANTSGFCFGVNRAVNTVYESAKKYKMDIFTYGPIIHNSDVVSDLEEKGVKVINNLEEIKVIKDGVVIIRSHGVSPEIYNVLKEHGILSIDMTCPYVKKIHRIVKENSEKGYHIIIIGNPSHPEVEGINGWCENKASIVSSLDECSELPKFDKICIVVQTTFSKEKWGPIREYLIEKKCNEYVDFNTICNSTGERQHEADELSKIVDAMIVIGGKHSSNTQKLYNICKKNCENTFHVENESELNLEQIKGFERVGITTGASTPNWVVDKLVDVLLKLDDENSVIKQEELKQQNQKEEEMSEETFEKMLDNLRTLEVGDIVKGKVMAISDDEAVIDIGYKSDGVLPASEMAGSLKEILKVGKTIEAEVVGFNQNDGSVRLSKKAMDVQKSWEKAKEAFENKTVALMEIQKEVKGGAQARFETLTVFIPHSQLSDKFVDINDIIGDTIPVKIMEFEEGRNIVASARIILEENKQKDKLNFWDSIYIGKDFIGEVKRLTSFGAFVDIGGIDGLLHVSEITWSKSDNPDKYMNIGDKVEVYVKDFDKEAGKVDLGLKNKAENPWIKFLREYSVGDIIEGNVVRITSFGAFITIQEGIDGLVHISRISDKRIKSPDEVLQIGERVKAKIVTIDQEERKVGLNIKSIAPIGRKGESNVDAISENMSFNENMNVTIGDALKNWKFEEE